MVSSNNIFAQTHLPGPFIRRYLNRRVGGTLPPPVSSEEHAPSVLSSNGSTAVWRPDRSHANLIARRIHGWSWQAFPVGMGTSAVYLTLSGWHEAFRPRDIVEYIFFWLTVTIFLVNVVTLLLQAILYPRHSKELLKDPQKSVFFPLIALSMASIIIGVLDNEHGYCRNICGSTCAFTLFWVYLVLSLVICMPMLWLWFEKPHPLSDFTPAYAFPIFPMMLTGVVAFNALRVIDPDNALESLSVLVTGYFFQGLGFFMTFFYICVFMLKIITEGFLEGRHATGSFIVCGPPGFTALAFIKLGDFARRILPKHHFLLPTTGDIWYAGSILSGIMLLGLAVFLFFFCLVPWWRKVNKTIYDILGFWALTFPNVGWILALRALSNVFEAGFLRIIHIVCCVILLLIWIVLFFLTCVAFYRGIILESSPEEVMKDAVHNSGHNREATDAADDAKTEAHLALADPV